MESSTGSPGDKIEARCTKCRKNTKHVIILVVEGEPDKVECNVCSRQHPFRPPTVTINPAVRQASLDKAAECEEWQRLQPGMNSVKAKDYSMTGAYKVKALIRHPAFGLGVVQRLVGAQKMEILFEDGKKTMRCK